MSCRLLLQIQYIYVLWEYLKTLLLYGFYTANVLYTGKMLWLVYQLLREALRPSFVV